MAEVLSGDMTPEQVKKAPNMQTLVDQSLVDGHLSEAEGMEIMIQLKIGKEAIFRETKSKLSAFLEENGQNWKSLKDTLEAAPVSDGAKNSAEKKDSKAPMDTKNEKSKKETLEQTDSSFVWDAYDSVVNEVKYQSNKVKTAIVGTETPEESAFMEWLSKIEIESWADVNKALDRWNQKAESTIQISKLTQAEKSIYADMKSEINALRIEKWLKTFDELTSNVKLEKWDNGYTLNFSIDPDGTDAYDNDKQYSVKLTGLDLKANTSDIRSQLVKAYMEQLQGKILQLEKKFNPWSELSKFAK